MELLKRSLMFALIFVISTSASFGLELSATAGNGHGSSSTDVVYGATVSDYANQNIKLNPNEGTLSNAYSGSGSLPSSSISRKDSKGNYVYVSRSVSGKPGTTTWSYDWNTYAPYSSTAGYGVGAKLWLSAHNAYSISGAGYAKNAEGDTAEASISVGSSYPSTTSSLSNYYVNPTAFTNEARVYQKADYATSTGRIITQGKSRNLENDYSWASIDIPSGTVSKPTTNVYSAKSSGWVYPTASSVYTIKAGGLNAYASNSEGDISNLYATVDNGRITNPQFYSWSDKTFAETWASIPSMYGKTAEITSQGKDKALGYQEDFVWNSEKKDWDRIKTPISRGEGDFVAKRSNNYAFNSVAVKTRATKSDVEITTSGFGSKTALILDPRRWEFVTDAGGKEIFSPISTALKNKGYAVTYYSDSAVSKDKVKKMDEYYVSAILTHASPYDIYLSKSSNGKSWDTMSASELKPAYTKYNGMALILGCDTFKNTGSGTWADATNKAKVRGGTSKSWDRNYVGNYANKFFTSMSNGNPAWYANLEASTFGWNPGLKLLGDTNFKL